MKLLTQIFLALLIILKLALGTILFHQVELDPSLLEGDAIAAEHQEVPEAIIKVEEHAAKEDKIDLNFLLKRRAELKREEEGIAKKRAELVAIREEINTKIAVLTQLRKEIRAEMARKKHIEERKIKHLIKAYSAMKPQKAASLIEKLEIAFATELLSNMKGDVAGNILSFVNVEKAARISEALAKRQ
ncbi:MAG: hypothetical protein V3W19_02735 [Desulfatiglandales bacterium]